MIVWQSLVQPGELVFEVGAGDGQGTDALLARGARVVCVEAHPERARRLRERFGSVGSTGAAGTAGTAGAAGADGTDGAVATASVIVVEKGVANRPGRIATGGAGAGIEVTTLDEMMRAFGVPRYCRLDVGGDPESILDGLSAPPNQPHQSNRPHQPDHPTIALLSFEFKAALMGHLVRAVARLVQLGYRHFNWRRSPDTELVATAWRDDRALLEEIARAAAGAGGQALRGDIFARAEPSPAQSQTEAQAQSQLREPERYAVSILRQPGNIHSECFRELAETVHGGLKALGHDSIFSEETRVPGRRNIVFGSNLIANLDAPHAFAPGSILYNLEQIYDGSPWLTAELLAAFRAHAVWDYSRANIEALGRHGVIAQHVPVGYRPELTRIPPAPVQDIDVLFVGSIAGRRLTILQALERAGAKVMAIYGRYGEERDRFIARAKIVLNIHFHDAKVFEIVRVSYLLANRCFVVSETGSDTDSETAFAGGVAFAAYDRLVDTCLAYLREPAARQAVAARGFTLMAALAEADALRPVVGDARAD